MVLSSMGGSVNYGLRQLHEKLKQLFHIRCRFAKIEMRILVDTLV